ncbi:hypothetical protein ABNG02_07545 [Halorubrum ejinorense]
MSSDNADHDLEGDDPASAVTFGPLKRALREHRYPVTTAELREQYGAAAVETPTASERFGGLLEGCEATRFREPREVRDAVLSVLSTRDGSIPDPSTKAADDWTRLRR